MAKPQPFDYEAAYKQLESRFSNRDKWNEVVTDFYSKATPEQVQEFEDNYLKQLDDMGYFDGDGMEELEDEDGNPITTERDDEHRMQNMQEALDNLHASIKSGDVFSRTEPIAVTDVFHRNMYDFDENNKAMPRHQFKYHQYVPTYDDWQNFTPNSMFDVAPQHRPLLTERFYKNFDKTSNPQKAAKEVTQFFSDHGYRINPINNLNNKQPPKIESLNSIRNLLQQFQQADERQEINNPVLEQLQQAYQRGELDRDTIIDFDTGHIHYADDGNVGDIVPDQVLEPYRKKVSADLTDKFEHSDDVKQAIDKGWRLFEDPADQIYTGMANELCIGDVCKYGTSHLRSYASGQRNKDKLLITKGNVVAEIVIQKDGDGNVISAEVNERNVNMPNNMPVPQNSPLRKEVRNIAKRLKGKYISDLYAKDVDRIVSDILLKYMPRTNQNLLNAIKRKY